MSDNCMRTNLVFQFYCFDCGSQLRFTYEDGEKMTEASCREQNPKLETGAMNRVSGHYVLPCAKCKSKYTKPLEDMKKALSSINGDL